IRAPLACVSGLAAARAAAAGGRPARAAAGGGPGGCGGAEALSNGRAAYPPPFTPPPPPPAHRPTFTRARGRLRGPSGCGHGRAAAGAYVAAVAGAVAGVGDGPAVGEQVAPRPAEQAVAGGVVPATRAVQRHAGHGFPRRDEGEAVGDARDGPEPCRGDD